MKKYLMICILTSLSFLAHAGEGSERASVEELLMLMKADSMIDNIYFQYGQTIKRMEQQLGIDQSNKAIFERYISRMVAIMKQEMNWKKMKEPMINVYLKHYSENEVQDMLAFYKSESGKSMVEKMPAVMKDSMLVSQSLMKEFIPKVQAMSKELKDEIIADKAIKK